MKLILYGQPITKKNSSRLITVNGRKIPIPSRAYKAYEQNCLEQLRYIYGKRETISSPVNVQCVYFMKTRRKKLDLINLQQATLDILKAGDVIADDCHEIVVALDGSRVLYDPENPRVEITITEIA